MTTRLLNDDSPLGKAATSVSSKARRESNVYFVGDEGGGKTSLLRAFLRDQGGGGSDQVESFKGLNYSFARNRRRNAHSVQQDVAHLWEMSGCCDFSTELCAIDNVFLGSKQVTTAVVVVVVDLSKPDSVTESGWHWIATIKKALDATYARLRARGSKLPDQLIARSNKLFANNHPDKGAVDHSGISLLIVAAKYDQFVRMEAEKKKVVARDLRYLAHANGAHLLSVSELRSSSTEAEDNGKMKGAFLHVIRHLAFHGLEKRLRNEPPLQRQYLRPLMVPAGQDSFDSIGLPHVQQPADFNKDSDRQT